MQTRRPSSLPQPAPNYFFPMKMRYFKGQTGFDAHTRKTFSKFLAKYLKQQIFTSLSKLWEFTLLRCNEIAQDQKVSVKWFLWAEKKRSNEMWLKIRTKKGFQHISQKALLLVALTTFFCFLSYFFGSRQKLRQMATEVGFLKLFEVCSCTNWDVLFGCLRSGSNSHLLCALQFTGRKFVVSYAPQNFSFEGGIKRSGPGGGGVTITHLTNTEVVCSWRS